MTLDALVRSGTTRFRNLFGRMPEFLAQAPGRVNLIGEHTDYTDGLCMPFAIDRHTLAVAATKGPERRTLNVVSALADGVQEIDLDADPLVATHDWTDYVRGVIQGLRQHDIETPAMDVLFHSTLPTGAGLSSSASLEVATIKVILAATGQPLDNPTIMQIALEAEHRYAGVPCGLLDQFSVVSGVAQHVLLFDSRTGTGEAVVCDLDTIAMTIVDSGIRHTLSDGSYAARRQECEHCEQLLGKSLRDATLPELERTLTDPILLKRARHVVSENHRVRQMRDALRRNNLTRIGSILFEGHASLRDDFEVSVAETDLLVALASEHLDKGLIGARMTGGGFGGSVLLLTEPSEAESLSNTIIERYTQATGIHTKGLRVYPSAGASVISARKTL